MPHPVHITWDVQPTRFAAGTVTPASYAVAIDDPTSTAIDVPYGTVHEADFPEVAAGHWTVSIDMKEPDGTHLGTLVTGTVDVPADDVFLDAPVMVHLSVGA
jgi:hypothetical protein